MRSIDRVIYLVGGRKIDTDREIGNIESQRVM